MAAPRQMGLPECRPLGKQESIPQKLRFFRTLPLAVEVPVGARFIQTTHALLQECRLRDGVAGHLGVVWMIRLALVKAVTLPLGNITIG